MVETKILISTVILLLVVACAAQQCGYTCKSDSDCSAPSSPCSKCIVGFCACPGGLAACQLREDYYKCYNSSAQGCCPQSFSHGNGALCNVTETCCDSFSIKVCNDPKTSFCCPYATYAQSCLTGNICCGAEYPFCLDPTKSQCCCPKDSDGLSCGLKDTCDCTNRKCVPPAWGTMKICALVHCSEGRLF